MSPALGSYVAETYGDVSVVLLSTGSVLSLSLSLLLLLSLQLPL